MFVSIVSGRGERPQGVGWKARRRPELQRQRHGSCSSPRIEGARGFVAHTERGIDNRKTGGVFVRIVSGGGERPQGFDAP